MKILDMTHPIMGIAAPGTPGAIALPIYYKPIYLPACWQIGLWLEMQIANYSRNAKMRPESNRKSIEFPTEGKI